MGYNQIPCTKWWAGLVVQHGGLRWWDSIRHELNNDLEDMIFISSSLLFGRSNRWILSSGEKYSVAGMLKIKIAPGVSFHVFRDTVEGLDWTVRKSFLLNFSVLINDLNANE